MVEFKNDIETELNKIYNHFGWSTCNIKKDAARIAHSVVSGNAPKLSMDKAEVYMIPTAVAAMNEYDTRRVIKRGQKCLKSQLRMINLAINKQGVVRPVIETCDCYKPRENDAIEFFENKFYEHVDVTNVRGQFYPFIANGIEKTNFEQNK